MIDAHQFPLQALAQAIALIVICVGWVAYSAWELWRKR